MLYSFNAENSCYDAFKYYKKHKRGDKFDFDLLSSNLDYYKRTNGFKKYINESFDKSNNKSLNILKINKEIKTIPMINNKQSKNIDKLSIVNILFIESLKYPDLSLQKKDVNNFVNKIILHKHKIIEEINDAFYIDSLYENYKKEHLEQKAKQCILSNKINKQTNTHLANLSFNLGDKQHESIKYITYQNILNNVIYHCIELRNESNSTLKIENISNAFDEEMIKIRQKFNVKNLILPIQKIVSGSVSSYNSENYNKVVFNYVNTNPNVIEDLKEEKTFEDDRNENNCSSISMKSSNIDIKSNPMIKRERNTAYINEVNEKKKRITKILLHRNQFEDVLNEIDKQYKSNNPYIVNKQIRNEMLEVLDISEKISETFDDIEKKFYIKNGVKMNNQFESNNRLSNKDEQNWYNNSQNDSFNNHINQDNGESKLLKTKLDKAINQIKIIDTNKNPVRYNSKVILDDSNQGNDAQDKTNIIDDLQLSGNQKNNLNAKDNQMIYNNYDSCNEQGTENRKQRMSKQSDSFPKIDNKSQMKRNKQITKHNTNSIASQKANNTINKSQKKAQEVSDIIKVNDLKVENKANFDEKTIKDKHKKHKIPIINAKNRKSIVTQKVLIKTKAINDNSGTNSGVKIELNKSIKLNEETNTKINYIESFNIVNYSFQESKYTLPRINKRYSCSNIIPSLLKEQNSKGKTYHSISFFPIKKSYHTPKKGSTLQSYQALLNRYQIQQIYKERQSLLNKDIKERNNKRGKESTDKTDDQTFDMQNTNGNLGFLNDRDSILNGIFYEPIEALALVKKRKSIYSNPISNRKFVNKNDLTRFQREKNVLLKANNETNDNKLLKQFKEIKALNPEDYANKMNALFDKQMHNLEETTLKEHEDRINNFKNELKINLLQSKYYRLKSSSKIQFLNISDVSIDLI